VPLNGSFATVYFVCASVAAVHSRSSYYPYLARNVRTSHTSFVITRRVTETAAEILRHLTLRASTPTTTSNSGFGSFLSPPALANPGTAGAGAEPGRRQQGAGAALAASRQVNY
jgi:hypothetical protein